MLIHGKERSAVLQAASCYPDVVQGKPYNIQHRIIRADNNETRYIHSIGEVESQLFRDTANT